MIKTFKQFNESLTQKQQQTIQTFIGHLKGYTFSNPKQLDAVANFIFGRPVEAESIESETGKPALRYVSQDGSFDVVIFYEDGDGGKYKVTDAINHNNISSISESINGRINIPSFMTKQQYEHLVDLLQQTSDHYIEFCQDDNRPVALYKSYNETSDSYINSFELENDGSIKVSLIGDEASEVSVILGYDFIMFDADEVISKVEEIHQDFV